MSTHWTQHCRGRVRRFFGRRTAVFALCLVLSLGDLPDVRQMIGAQDQASDPSPATAVPVPDGNATAVSIEPSTGAAAAGAAAGVTAARPEASLDELLERKGTLELREGTLADWMLAIQKTWVGLNILYDNDALQQIQYTGRLADMPLKTILDTILPPKNFGFRRQGNALVILPLQEFGEGGDPNLQRSLVRMDYVSPTDAEPSLRHLLSPKGKLFPVPSAQAMMVVDYPDNLKLIREHLAELDDLSQKAAEHKQDGQRRGQPSTVVADPSRGASSPGDPSLGPSMTDIVSGAQLVDQTITTVLWPKFVMASSVAEGIQMQIADGTVSAISEINALVVTGNESAVRSATQLLKQLDVARKQVRISVYMYDVRVDALEQLGVNWRHAGKGRISANGIPRDLFDLHSSPLPLGGSGASASGTSGTTTGTGTTTGGGTTTGTTGGGLPPGSLVTSAGPNIAGSVLTLAHLSRHFDLTAVILALDQTDGARLLARPSVTCYDHIESEIKIISEIPVQQLTQTDMGGNIGTTTFREAGVTLRVTPWIGDDGRILLKLAPEFSLLTGFSQSGQPIIDRRTQTGQVMVQTGETLVLGGLRRRSELETVAGIPGLMNLKYVGTLFRSHRTTVEESELITFIHTEIIEPGYRGMLREQIAGQIVEETLDRIPTASHSPFIPPCNDPYCPLHNPRPKYWQGSVLTPDGYIPGQRAGAPPVLQPDYSRGHPDPGQGAHSPAVYRLREGAPAGDNTAPPVEIDVSARGPHGGGHVLHRLPQVESPSEMRRLPVVAAGANDPVPHIANLPERPPIAPSPLPPNSAPKRMAGGSPNMLR